MNQVAPSTRKLMKLAQNAMDKQRGQEAIDLLQQVLALNPGHVEAVHKIATILHSVGNYDAALELYQRAIRTDPTYADSYILLSALLESKNQWADALQISELATQMIPNDPRTHAQLVSTYLRFNRSHLAPDYLEKILPNFPEDAELHQLYVMALKINNRRAEAEAVYATIRKKFKLPAFFRVNYETYMPRFYLSTEEIDGLRAHFSAAIERFIAEKPSLNIVMLSIDPLFSLAFHNRDNKALLTRYSHMLRLCVPQLNYVAPHCKLSVAKKEGPIRIGFISRHMHNHSVGNCYRGAMIYLSQQPEYEVTFFNLANVMDDKIQEIIQAGVPIISLPKNVLVAHKVVADKKLDMVIYPDIGMDAMTHHMAMARLAPYQACFQGHPETTGIDTIDYVISSRSYEPPNAEENYTERLLCNPGVDTIFKRPTPPERWLNRAELGLPEDKKLYVCPMAIQKFHPDYDDVLADILAADPNATLVLFNDFMQQAASDLLQQRILQKCDAPRVIFLKWQPLDHLFSILKEADAILDTIYFGGGTTAQYAFGLGFPIVTMPGKYARGRVVFSYYSIMGMEAEAPLAASPQEYVSQAVRLANDSVYKDALCKKIIENNHLLFESAPYGPRLAQLVKDIMSQNLEGYRR